MANNSDGNVYDFVTRQRVLAEQQRVMEQFASGDLRGGGGRGTSDGMEPRIAKLEAHMENVRTELTKLGVIPERLRAVEVRVDHLPSKGFIVAVSVTTIALLTSVIVFADKLRALIG